MSREERIDELSCRYLLDFVERILGFVVSADCFLLWYEYCRLNDELLLSRSMVRRTWKTVFPPLDSSKLTLNGGADHE